MARATTNKKPFNKKTYNAAGYAKRKSLKGKAVADSSDVYEYQSERVRRSKVKLLLEKDELQGAGGDDSDAEGDASERRRPRLVGEDDEDDRIGSDEDEEIDSDAAFDESDEEQFAGFNFSSNKKSQPKKSKAAKPSKAKEVRFAEIDLNEDSEMGDAAADSEEDASEVNGEESEEEEEEEGEPDEFIDVLDILDGRGEADIPDDIGQVEIEGKDGRIRGEDESDEEEGRGSEKEDEDEEDEDPSVAVDPDEFSADEDDEADPSALDHLGNFITSLDAGTKRKAPEEGDSAEAAADDKRKRRRRMLKEQTQTGLESEFAAQAGASKLSLDDLLAPLDSSSSTLQSLKKSVKVLASSSSKAKTLSAPLAHRAQERLDREAAYEQTKEEIDKWSATMRRIKDAEHLSFPLQAEGTSKVSNLELAAKFKPTTELESAVDRLLKSAKMREQDIAQTEALKMNHLSVEEVAQRRAELAKMRELMFRAEAKAKRVAKIKSKTYRRLKKKEKAKLAAKLGELSDAEDDEEAQLKHEVERARERATLRHKNTGKWAQAMKHRGELDEDQRRDIHEMLDRGEKLRRRIQGRDSDESGDEDEDTDIEGEGADARIKARAFDELRAVEDADADAPEAQGKKGKSVFEMKFMKDAMARDKRRADEIADDFVRELGGRIPDEDEEGDEEGPRPPDASTQRMGGRMSFRPGNIPELSRALPSLASDTSSVTLKSTDLAGDGHADSSMPASPTSPLSQRPTVPQEPANPWLATPEDGPSRGGQKKHEVVVGKNSKGAEKSKAKLRKRVRQREEEKEKAREEAAVEISMTDVMTIGAGAAQNAEAGPSKPAKSKQPQKKASAQASAEADDDDVHSEVEEQERLAAKGKGRAKGVKAFEQRELVARAFAGDNVMQEFEEAKRREIQEDAPKEVDTTLAGWGSWGGQGTKKAAPKPYLVKKVAGVDPTTRADYKKAHVIISEKRDKKAARYLVKDLPFPYTSKAQFERNMDTPIGTEWNTRVGFQRSTLPKVVKKMGTVITPLEKLA
ncbi:Utp14 domain-containing protein [Phanerochaete sordida]|uniref:Utp14 domain-containing protein n=1 Tax=Phanerochaete sordida TaxID=48140 RepID=A0A9P3GL15_9APHY|nr:Utp14 domain-containing protein [Phanerochaete sordida]